MTPLLVKEGKNIDILHDTFLLLSKEEYSLTVSSGREVVIFPITFLNS